MKKKKRSSSAVVSMRRGFFSPAASRSAQSMFNSVEENVFFFDKTISFRSEKTDQRQRHKPRQGISTVTKICWLPRVVLTSKIHQLGISVAVSFKIFNILLQIPLHYCITRQEAREIEKILMGRIPNSDRRRNVVPLSQSEQTIQSCAGKHDF